MRKQGEANLTICSHVKQDLVASCEKYLPGLGEVKPIAVVDYRYRTSVSPAELVTAMSKIVRDITYDNFRNSVAEKNRGPGGHIFTANGKAFLTFQRRILQRWTYEGKRVITCAPYRKKQSSVWDTKWFSIINKFTELKKKEYRKKRACSVSCCKPSIINAWDENRTRTGLSPEGF